MTTQQHFATFITGICMFCIPQFMEATLPIPPATPLLYLEWEVQNANIPSGIEKNMIVITPDTFELQAYRIGKGKILSITNWVSNASVGIFNETVQSFEKEKKVDANKFFKKSLGMVAIALRNEKGNWDLWLRPIDTLPRTIQELHVNPKIVNDEVKITHSINNIYPINEKIENPAFYLCTIQISKEQYKKMSSDFPNAEHLYYTKYWKHLHVAIKHALGSPYKLFPFQDGADPFPHRNKPYILGEKIFMISDASSYSYPGPGIIFRRTVKVPPAYFMIEAFFNASFQPSQQQLQSQQGE